MLIYAPLIDIECISTISLIGPLINPIHLLGVQKTGAACGQGPVQNASVLHGHLGELQSIAGGVRNYEKSVIC
jgi:hypothetical protein